MSKLYLTELQEKALAKIMLHGKGKPITGKDIANSIGLVPRETGKEGADMRSIIHALRIKGYPICASGNGYWYAQTQEELSAYIMSLQGRIDDQQAAVEGLKKGFDKVAKTEIPKEARKPKYRYEPQPDGTMREIAVYE